MDKKSSFLSIFIIVLLFGAGCAKKDGVDTAKLETSFSTAEPATKSQVEQAVSSIKSADYPAALASLQKVASQAKLTPEQQQAISDVMAQVQKQLGSAVEKASGDARKALENAGQSLPKP